MTSIRWVPLPEAARTMGLSRVGALAKLRRRQYATGELIVRKIGGRWEVSPVGLERATSDRRESLTDLERRLARVERILRRTSRQQ